MVLPAAGSQPAGGIPALAAHCWKLQAPAVDRRAQEGEDDGDQHCFWGTVRAIGKVTNSIKCFIKEMKLQEGIKSNYCRFGRKNNKC